MIGLTVESKRGINIDTNHLPLSMKDEKCIACEVIKDNLNGTCRSCYNFINSYAKNSESKLEHEFCQISNELNQPKCRLCRLDQLVLVGLLKYNSNDLNHKIIFKLENLVKENVFFETAVCAFCPSSAEKFLNELEICKKCCERVKYWNYAQYENVLHLSVKSCVREMLVSNKLQSIDLTKLKKLPRLCEVIKLKIEWYKDYNQYLKDYPIKVQLDLSEVNSEFKFNQVDKFNKRRFEFELLVDQAIEDKNQVGVFFKFLLITSQRPWFKLNQNDMFGIATLKKTHIKITEKNGKYLLEFNFIAKNFHTYNPSPFEINLVLYKNIESLLKNNNIFFFEKNLEGVKLKKNYI